MSDDLPLRPSEFSAAVEDYSRGSLEDAPYVRICYAAQLAAVGHPTRDPVTPVEFTDALEDHAGAELAAGDHDRVEHVYQTQIKIARLVSDNP